VVPAYYNRNSEGVPVEWISYIKNSLVKVAPEFTTKRMIDDYYRKYYLSLWDRSRRLEANDYKGAIEIRKWKDCMRGEWNKLEILSSNLEKPKENVYRSGKIYKGEVILNINGIRPDDIGVEFIITRMLQDGRYEYVAGYDLELIDSRDGRSLYKLELAPEKAGTFFYGLRLYPRNDDLPHRQDFYLLKWIV